KIFEPGFTSKSRGWGLGLSLAKRIIEEYHGGKLTLEQSIPGEGTTFKISLPIA
ncbi:ATP-binding protein, partial [Schleiferiaceae bacterium]|nr:ATP-binding protein [Schleiferiaceae bacterium]